MIALTEVHKTRVHAALIALREWTILSLGWGLFAIMKSGMHDSSIEKSNLF